MPKFEKSMRRKSLGTKVAQFEIADDFRSNFTVFVKTLTKSAGASLLRNEPTYSPRNASILKYNHLSDLGASANIGEAKELLSIHLGE